MVAMRATVRAMVQVRKWLCRWFPARASLSSLSSLSLSRARSTNRIFLPREKRRDAPMPRAAAHRSTLGEGGEKVRAITHHNRPALSRVRCAKFLTNSERSRILGALMGNVSY